MSNNNIFSKAGEYMGDALMKNPNYPINKIIFRDVCLEENGLRIIMEAANLNTNILRLHVGVVTDAGLKIMAELLPNNRSLIKLEF